MTTSCEQAVTLFLVKSEIFIAIRHIESNNKTLHLQYVLSLLHLLLNFAPVFFTRAFLSHVPFDM